MNAEEGGLFACRPILCVENVARGIAYYVEALGFHLGWSWSDSAQRFLRPGDEAEPTFALVGRGPVQFMLAQKCQGAPGMWLHLDVQTAERLDALYAEWARKGALILEPPSCRPWGMYEMRVRDPDGHVLRLSSPVPQNGHPAPAAERPRE